MNYSQIISTKKLLEREVKYIIMNDNQLDERSVREFFNDVTPCGSTISGNNLYSGKELMSWLGY